MITMMHRWLSKPLARNLRKPAGIFGQLTAKMMNTTNAVMTATAIDTLNVLPDQYTLDIGFGGGMSLVYLLGKNHRGHVSGLEIADTMLRRARNYYREFISDGVLSLHEGSIEVMPFSDNQFDRICTLNTIYFWHDPKRASAEMYRICKPRARVVVAFRSREVMQRMKFSRHGFNLYSIDEIVVLLEEAGFGDIAYENHNTDELGFTCITACK